MQTNKHPQTSLARAMSLFQTLDDACFLDYLPSINPLMRCIDPKIVPLQGSRPEPPRYAMFLDRSVAKF